MLRYTVENVILGDSHSINNKQWLDSERHAQYKILETYKLQNNETKYR